MSDCPDCAAAEADPKHAVFSYPCHACRVRAMAHSTIFFEHARSDQRRSVYRRALQGMGIEAADVMALAMRLKGVPSA